MGMTIDESNRILVDRYIDTYVVCGGWNYNPTINITREDYEAFKVAIHTMRKYQKIEQILKNNPYGGEATVRRIQEVVEVEKLKQLQDDYDKERKNLMIECDMLQGNINRMMVTHDHEELLTMFAYAHKRLGDIYWNNKKRINIEAVENGND